MIENNIFNASSREHFEMYGFVRLGCVLKEIELQKLKQRINEIMLGEVKYANMLFQLDSENGEYGNAPAPSLGHESRTLAYRKIMGLEQDPIFLKYMQHPVFRAITKYYIGNEVSIYRAMFMNKPADRGTELPWHQDVGWGWGVDTDPTITIWTALDPATVANGCMQIIPGSHKHGVINKHHWLPEEKAADYVKLSEVEYLEAQSGEVILLHNLLLHRSGTNPSKTPRRAFSIAYMEGATKMRETGESFPMVFGESALRP
ncbi:MAG: phytanoyl-CoA dioxygenase [Gemmatimonadetes bacterium]|nr:phytanoyl-CoA dioxygenase [Gemmatimonadota bacterium]